MRAVHATLDPSAASARPETVRFVGPSWRDSRLHTAAVLVTVQVLGQTVLGFDVSIAQILLAVGTSALLEVAITFRRTRTIAWPASAMLTGNGVALILRVPGTVRCDWWSLRGGWIYVTTAAVSLGSKYVIRRHGGHVFNPSNFGLLVCFLVLGSRRVEPLDFWWAPWSAPVAAAVAVIVTGGVLVLRRIHLLAVALSFWLTFAASLGVVTLAGHCITARWHVGPLCGFDFWRIIVTSPELLVFVLFMITDPRTVATGSRRAHAAFGALVGVVAALLIAPQRTEFGAKVALLGALAIVCAARPTIEAWARTRHALRRPRAAIVALGLVAALAAAGLPARPVSASARAAHDSVRFPRVVVPTARVASDALSQQLDGADARRIARDLVEDLAVQDGLVRRRDADAARAVAGRRWLAVLEARMRAFAADHEITVDDFAVRSVVVSVGRRPGQAAPAVLATLRGTARALTWHDGLDGPRRTGAPRPVEATFEVRWDGTRYLIVSDVAPPGWRPPAA